MLSTMFYAMGHKVDGIEKKKSKPIVFGFWQVFEMKEGISAWITPEHESINVLFGLFFVLHLKTT